MSCCESCSVNLVEPTPQQRPQQPRKLNVSIDDILAQPSHASYGGPVCEVCEVFGLDGEGPSRRRCCRRRRGRRRRRFELDGFGPIHLPHGAPSDHFHFLAPPPRSSFCRSCSLSHASHAVPENPLRRTTPPVHSTHHRGRSRRTHTESGATPGSGSLPCSLAHSHPSRRRPSRCLGLCPAPRACGPWGSTPSGPCCLRLPVVAWMT